MQRVMGLCLAGVMAWTLVPRAATACSFADSFEPLELSSASPPDDEPDLPKVTLTLGDVRRGTGPQRAGCVGKSVTSCDDSGVIEIILEGFDRDAAYLFESEGTLPNGLQLPTGPVRIVGANGLAWLRWSDGATDDQEAFNFRVTVTPMDEYGRLGETSDPLVVADHPRGCAASGGGRGALAVALAWLLVAARRRRPA